MNLQTRPDFHATRRSLQHIFEERLSQDLRQRARVCLVPGTSAVAGTSENALLRQRPLLRGPFVAELHVRSQRPPFHMANSEVALDSPEAILLHAARFGDLKVVEGLIKQPGINPNCSHHSHTPILIAAAMGQVEAVEILLASERVDPNFRNNLGWTPLMTAAAQGHREIVRVLLSADRVDPHILNHKSRTALDVATNAGHTRIARIIGAELARRNRQFTSLADALQNNVENQMEVARFAQIARAAEEREKLTEEYLKQSEEALRAFEAKHLLKCHELEDTIKDLEEGVVISGVEVPRLLPDTVEGLRDLTHSLFKLGSKVTQALVEIQTCPVCMDSAKDATLVPCGHRLCGSCAEKVDLCPECRLEITTIQKTRQ